MRGYISTTYVFSLSVTGSSDDMLYKVTTYRPATGTDNGEDTVVMVGVWFPIPAPEG